jgi:GT2 family glycosyltransferase
VNDIQLKHLANLVTWLTAADILVTVDTGPAHIAAALGIPMVVLGQSSSPELHYSDQRDFETVWPKGDLDCLNCQQNICPKSNYSPPCQSFDPEVVADVVNRKLNPDTVSALIPTFRADANNLSKCINNVVDQVDEVVLTIAADGQLPTIPNHPKVRVVRCPRSNIGFGRNVNFGMRHTFGRWVLLLNDDCYLNGNTVELLKAQRHPTVGMIAHLLRYPNGQIYFAGRHRKPGDRGFPHINHRDYEPDISVVSEMEAVSGTSVLINRKAFYDIHGFDERFHMYAEDDDISLRMRQSGYRLLYHPTALGVHEGSATVKTLGKQGEWIQASAKLMEKLWGWYWTKNKTTIPGVFK